MGKTIAAAISGMKSPRRPAPGEGKPVNRVTRRQEEGSNQDPVTKAKRRFHHRAHGVIVWRLQDRQSSFEDGAKTMPGTLAASGCCRNRKNKPGCPSQFRSPVKAGQPLIVSLASD
ncbi:MAG: hypothetical protein ABSC03_18510 [Verrucomicrobiota bacterium]|jgi:hypothetical protein